MNNRNKFTTIAVGWLNTSKKDGSQYISAKANGKTQKVRLLLQNEDGSTVPLDNFAVFFNKEKANEKAPDVQFVFSNEQR